MKKQRSDKIEIDKDQVRRANDPILIAELFFPDKKAGPVKAAFLAIMYEIAKHQGKVQDFRSVSEEYRLSAPVINKARAKLSRLGIIRHNKKENYWYFSGDFTTNLLKVIDRLDSLKHSPVTIEQHDRMKSYIEMAKGGNKKKE